MGRRPARDEQPAAALVDVVVRHHHRLCRHLPGAIPRLGHPSRHAEVEQHRPVGRRAEKGLRDHGAGLRQVRRHAGRGAGQGRPGHGHWRTPVCQQLRPVPWLRRPWQQGLSQPDGQRLAGWQRRRLHPENRAGRTGGRDARHGCCGGYCRRCEERGQLCAEPVGQPAQQRGSPVGQGQVRGLRGLSWCNRPRQPLAGRAQSERQDLAARLGRRGHLAHRQQRQAERDAGVRASALTRAGHRAVCLCVEPVAAHGGGGSQMSADCGADLEGA